MSVDTSLFGAMDAARRGANAQLPSSGPGDPSRQQPPNKKETTTTTSEDPRVTAARIAADAQKALYNAERQERIRATTGTVKAAFEQYGLGSLYPMILRYAEMGLTEDEIYLNLRSTPEYKARFPAMETLASRGQAISEAAYVDYERKAVQLEQNYGIPSGMVSGSVTDLLVGDVSLVELQDRLTLASADALTAPDDLKRQIRDYYGLDPETSLRAYYLDPERALPILQQESATARIGVQASRAGVSGFERAMAEELQGIGVTEEAARQGFQQTAQMANLSAGRGDVVNQNQLISGFLKQDTQALQDIERAQRARTGRFQGGGGFTATQQGVSGLGSAATR